MMKLIAVIALATSVGACTTAGYGERPAAWCGWYMRQQVAQDPGEKFNAARAWAKLGTATKPEPGAIVVWRHHVGRIEQVTGPGKAVITSGNDGHEVRTRERSLRGVIAIRRL